MIRVVMVRELVTAVWGEDQTPSVPVGMTGLGVVAGRGTGWGSACPIQGDDSAGVVFEE